LKLHDATDDDKNNTGEPMVIENVPSAPSLRTTLDDANLEQNFFLDMKAFLKELKSIRNYILQR
jgi:hypothetical protein